MLKSEVVGVIALVAGITVIPILIGPLARRLASEHAGLSSKESADVLAAARDTLLRAAGGIILLVGAIGTVGTLIYTAQTARSDQQQAAVA